MMNDVGRWVGLLARSFNFKSFSCWVFRIVRSIKLHAIKESMSTIPSALIRSGFFKKVSLTISGSLRNERFLSTPSYSL